MGVTVAVTRTICQVAGGNQNITTADLGGLTPKAAWFIVTQAVSDGVAADHAVVGMGAATATDERWACGFQDENGVGTTETNRRGMTDECVLKLNTGAATVDGEADFVAFIADGVTINWGNAPAAAYLLTVILFAGTDLTAQADSFSLGNQNIETDVNTVGFQPDVILTATQARPFDDVASSQARYSHGVVTFDGIQTIVQLCYAWNSLDTQAATSVAGRITDDYGTGEVGAAGTFSWAGEFSNFDGNGFSCTPRLGNSGDDVGFLALDFGGVVDFWAGIIDSPIANGNNSWNDPNFEPQYVHIGLTQMLAVDTAYIDENAGSLGVSTFDADDEYSNSWQSEDAEATTDTQSLSDDTAINLPDDDGTVSWLASFVSFDALGWTLNFTQSEGTAVKWWALAIETEEVAPTITTITPPRLARNLMYIEQITFREPYGLQLVGGDDERLEIFLAQRGLPGV